MAFWMRSVGMLISRAFCMARRRRKLPSGLPPPSLAEIVISRLARVKAWPRLASTTAFLCLMPAHFECPDIQLETPNIVSTILLQPDSNEVSLSRLQHVSVGETPVHADLVAVDPHAALLD